MNLPAAITTNVGSILQQGQIRSSNIFVSRPQVSTHLATGPVAALRTFGSFGTPVDWKLGM